MGNAQAAAPMSTPSGSPLGHYVTIKALGRGGFGTVELVQSYQNGRKYALKKIRLEEGGLPFREEREVDCYRSLDHPHIVKYVTHHLDNVKRKFYIVMEYCEGGTLKDQIKLKRQQGNGRFIEVEILRWGVAMCDALSYLHQKNIIHRDMKPENVLLFGNGTLKLSDFGLARDTQAETVTTKLCGTVCYMPPECFEQKHVDKGLKKQWDAWSTGCVLHELCCLQFTFDGDNPILIYKKICNDPHAPVPADYENMANVINGMLVKDPTRRMTATEAFTQLKTALKTTYDIDSDADTSYLCLTDLRKCHQGTAAKMRPIVAKIKRDIRMSRRVESVLLTLDSSKFEYEYWAPYFGSKYLNWFEPYLIQGGKALTLNDNGFMTILLSFLMGDRGKVVCTDEDNSVVQDVRKRVEENASHLLDSGRIQLTKADKSSGYPSAGPYDVIYYHYHDLGRNFDKQVYLNQLSVGGLLIHRRADNISHWVGYTKFSDGTVLDVQLNT